MSEPNRVCVKSNHILNLLNRENYIEDLDYFDFESNLDTQDSTHSQNIKPSVPHRNRCIDIDRISTSLRDAIKTKSYKNPKSILARLNITVDNESNLVMISVPNISDNLMYSDPVLNRVLHQSKAMVFDSRTYLPLFYLENQIDSFDIAPISRDNTYLDKYLYNVVDTYRYGEFDHTRVFCYKNHIGAQIVIFHAPNKSDELGGSEGSEGWMFYFSGKIHRLCIETHAVLFEHIGDHLDKLDKNYVYHIVLVDSRLRIRLQSPSESKYMVLTKINRINDLDEYGIDHPAVPQNLFVENKRYFFSCLDHLDLYLEEMDGSNIKNKKLYNRGLIVKVIIDEFDPISITYDTYTYKRLKDIVPIGMGIHEAHLYLYQIDKLNNFLQYVDEADNAVLTVTRINLAIVTLGREILDIYHYTRNKENPELFALLSNSYRNILHNLHGQFIGKKSGAGNTFKTNFNDFGTDEKVSITTEDVYTTLKKITTGDLVQLFLDRDVLKDKIVEHDTVNNTNLSGIIKNCNSTNLQTMLLKH